ncbi:MAG: EAL domain-containing protein [Pseudomonadales bacterium]|nr:EAL domain-containing protein [Pseudomonadales bacterium]MBO6595770.1 EAL domain-containing protein [Pseudomonadales bacterium]MBO6658637.1 EAL domain-containing protein [Pseudomonadales bacterium]MBO6702375.1 EAL domain-containing protein [Pseudomonadales bacterium]MBO6822255.1 EAL domain-containing protein [Pseudomonadales bacterium]
MYPEEKKGRILVVEDEILVARDIQQRLQKMGFEIAGHETHGENAITTALEVHPDLILMDINLAGDIDGIDAAKSILEEKEIPVIFCTAYSNEEVLARAKVTTPYGYVLKPFDNRELQINIEIALVKHKIELDLERTRTRLDATLSNVSDGVIAAEGDGRICFMNPVAERILSKSQDTCIGSKLNKVLDLEEFEMGQTAIDLLDPDTFAGWRQFTSLRQMLKRGDYRVPIEISATFLDDAENLTVVTIRDITQQLGYEDAIQKNAFYDGLTDLPNRSLFSDRLAGSFNRRIRSFGSKDDFAVLFLDLDGFSVINEGYGHEAGDEVILEVARRLTNTVRPDDTVARMSGDVFAVLLDPITGLEGSVQACQRILDSIGKPFRINDQNVNLSATIGIVLNQGEYESPEPMMRDAETALHRAKEEAEGRYVVFDNRMYQDALKFIDRKSSMQRAITAGEFEVYYQPIVDARTTELVSMEALVRWIDPTEGFISPGEFIPMAESTGLIRPLGSYILRSVCRQISAWDDMGYSNFRVAVNFSARQFEDDVSELVQDAIANSGIRPESLAMEITEGLAMKDIDRNVSMLSSLRDLGVNISMDDFGTGYSSLAYIKKFPLTTLKIDRSFIKDMHENDDDKEITKAIIAMGKSLSLATLAEGVENQEQLDLLRSYGCDYIQGFFFSKPLPADEMTAYLSNCVAA